MSRRVAVLAIGSLVAPLVWSLAYAGGRDVHPGVATLVAIGVVLGTGASSQDRDRVWWGRILGLAGIVAASKLLHLLFGGLAAARREPGSLPDSLIDVDTAVAVFLGVGAWLVATTSIDQLSALGQDGPPSASYIGVLERLWTRFMRGGYLLLAVGAFGLLRLRTLGMALRPMLRGPLLPAVIYFLVGVAWLGFAARGHRIALWEREGATVGPEVAERWVTGITATLIAGALLGALFVSFDTFMGTLPSGLIAVLARLVGLMASLVGVREAPSAEEGEGEPDDSTPVAFDPHEGLEPVEHHDPLAPNALVDFDWTAVLVGFSIVVVTVAVVAAWRRRRQLVELFGEIRSGESTWLAGIMAILGMLVSGIVELARMLGAMLGFGRKRSDRSPQQTRSRPSVAERPHGRWYDSADPQRKKVARAYRSFLRSSGRKFGVRSPWQTPDEYRRRMLPILEPVARHIDELTSVFLDARFGRDAVPEERAEMAGEAAREIKRAVRRTPSRPAGR